MPVSVGGRRLGPSADQLLDWLASLWVEATEEGEVARRLEAKIKRQQDWLDSNRDDPRYPGRVVQAHTTLKDFDFHQLRLHQLAAKANELVGMMDGPLRERSRREVHEWSVIGSPGVYATAWDLIPDPAWLEEAETQP
jgi:hypothetical protein